MPTCFSSSHTLVNYTGIVYMWFHVSSVSLVTNCSQRESINCASPCLLPGQPFCFPQPVLGLPQRKGGRRKTHDVHFLSPILVPCRGVCHQYQRHSWAVARNTKHTNWGTVDGFCCVYGPPILNLRWACLYFSVFSNLRFVFSKHVKREFSYDNKMLKVQLSTKSRSS